MDTNQNQFAFLNNATGTEPKKPTVGGEFGYLQTPDKPLRLGKIGSEEMGTLAGEEGAKHLMPIINAIYGQESESGANGRTSTDGAMGGMQIMPDTFKRFAKQGESIDNPVDNMRVGMRIIKSLGDKFGNDPAKIATGYFSGDGNVYTGTGSAWKADRKDGNGKLVSGYVADVLGRLSPIKEARADESLPDLNRIPKWGEIATSERFMALPDEEKAKVKGMYFDDNIAPYAGEDAQKARSQFMAQRDTVPGIGEKVSEKMAGIVPAVKDLVGLNGKQGSGSVMDGYVAKEPGAVLTHDGLPARQNADGSHSTEISITVTDPRLNGGKPTNIPSLWGGKEVDENAAVSNALVSGKQYQAFDSIDQAVSAAKAKSQAGGANAPMVRYNYMLENSQTLRNVDTSVEGRRARLVAQGEDPQFADRAAREGAAAGVAPGAEIAYLQKQTGTIRNSDFDFETSDLFKKQTGVNNPVVRGLARAGAGTTKALAGYTQFMGDVLGIDGMKESGVKAGGWARGKESAIGEQGTYLERNLEGAINSIGQQLPLMITGVKMESEALPLAGMALQSFGQEYSDGRSLGQSPAEATQRAGIFAAFEVIGEKFGLGDSMKAIKAAAQGMPNDKIVGFLWSALKKEVPGELLTTTGQFVTDKYAQKGVALNPNATGADYLEQVGQTITQTIMQSGVMAGGTTGVGTAARYLRDKSENQNVQAILAEDARAKALDRWNAGLLGVPRDQVAAAEQWPKNAVVADNQGASVAEPQQTAAHPTSVVAHAIVGDLADAAGVPREFVLPQQNSRVSRPANAGAISDQDVLNYAEMRRDQLLSKMHGQIEQVQTESGLADREVPGQALTPQEQAELNTLESQDPAEIRSFYGMDQQSNQNQPGIDAIQENQHAQIETQTESVGATPSPPAVEPTGQPIGTAIESQQDSGLRQPAENLASMAGRDASQQVQPEAPVKQDQSADLNQPAPAQAAPAAAFDVSGRNDQQLRHLATNGQPGWKEAAQAELAKRGIVAAAQTQGQFKSSEEAQAYIGGQRRASSVKLPKALPLPYEDGSFGVVTEGHAGWDRALEFQSATKPKTEKEAKARRAAVDAAANRAATSKKNDLPQPTEAQKEAGNYKKGHVTLQGLDIAIENPRGSERSEKRPDGSTWTHKMSDHYGYVKRTTGADGEQVDVYVGSNPDSKRVFIVDQLDQQTGGFDEHKAMLGFDNQESAIAAYKANFDAGWKVGPVLDMSMDEFKTWLANGDTSKPVADAKPKTEKEARARRAANKSNQQEVQQNGIEAEKTVTPESGQQAEVSVSDATDSVKPKTEKEAKVAKAARDMAAKADHPVADGVEAIAAQIQQSIAGHNIKANEKIAHEQVAKGYITQEQADADLERTRKMWDGVKPNERTLALANAVAAKDPRPLVGAWAKEGQGTYGVEGSMAAFEKITGVKLLRLGSAARAKAIFDWAGWSEDQVAADIAERRKSNAEQKAAYEAKRQKEDDERIEKRAASEMVEFRDTGDKNGIKDYIDGLVAQGFNRIITSKVGAITKTYLADEKGAGYPLPVGLMRDYAELAVRMAGAPKPEATTGKPKTEKEARARREAEKSKNDPISAIDSHQGFISRLNDGDMSVDEFRAHFEAVINNKSKIIGELLKLTKDKMLARLGGYAAQRYKSEAKDKIAAYSYRQMLDDFVLGDSISYGFGAKYEDVIRNYVEGYDQESLDDYAKTVKERRDARSKEADQKRAAMNNPQTIDDFVGLIRSKMADGMTSDQARRSLTAEQRKAYDDLVSEQTRKGREQQKEARATSIRATAQTTSGQIVQAKHTKTGEDLFVVKTADRVEHDVYNQWNATAKKLGGRYSSFRGAGAVPGFQFKTNEAAEAFLKYLGGDTVAAKDAVTASRDAYADDKSQTAVERLQDMADRLEERADASMNQDRKANTERRARFAAAAESAARADIALAKTMRNIAGAINDGSAKLLDRVRQKAQVELLSSAVRTAQSVELRDKYPSYQDQESRRADKPTMETADYAKWPTYTAFRSDLAGLARQLLQVDGAKKLGQRLLKVADDITDAYQKFAKENLNKVSTFTTKDGAPAIFSTAEKAEEAIRRSGFNGKATTISFKRGEHMVIMGPEMAKEAGFWQGDDDKRITLNPEFGRELVQKAKEIGGRNGVSLPWVFANTDKELAQWKAIGIETPFEMRAALREFIGLQERPAQADKVKELERKMIGRKNDGLDFFPTPAATAQEMIDAADIQDGMSVLEPSAGWGHIAEQIRDISGVAPEVIEMSSDRRELLEAKGFNVVGSDFMEATGKYDRIVMNPPFSERRDAEHVKHAYSLLKPGGRIVSIMGEGVFFGQDKKAKEFRDWLDSVGGASEKLAEGTFNNSSLPVNTGANTRMVVINKPDAGRGETMFSRSSANASGDKYAAEQDYRSGEWGVTDTRGNFIAQYKNRYAAEDAAAKLNAQGQLGFDITPEMRKRVAEGLPLFSRGKSGQGMALRDLKAIVDRARSSLKNLPQVHVLQSPSGLDMENPSQKRLHQEIYRRGAESDVEGVSHDGEIYLFADNLADEFRAEHVLVNHEVGHYGLREVFGRSGLDPILNTIYMTNAKVRKQADALRNKFDLESNAEATEEVLVEMAPNELIKLNAWRRLVRHIRDWLASHGFGKMSERLNSLLKAGMTEQQKADMLVADVVNAAREWVRNGTPSQASTIRETKLSRLEGLIPDSIILAELGSAKAHPDHDAAKAGNGRAAANVAKAILTPEVIQTIKDAVGTEKPIVLPVVAHEASGHNQIPLAAAMIIGHELGLDVSTNVYQASASKRTAMDGLSRIFGSPSFAGEVEAGKTYMLVDDTVTQGATFAELAGFIQERGGKVIANVALTGKQYSAKLQITEETLGKLRDKFGDIEDQFEAATGRSFDTLTESEARYLSSYKPADEIRSRIIAEGSKGSSDRDSQGSGVRLSRKPIGEVVRNLQGNAVQFFGNQDLKAFSALNKTINTQFHKALKDKDFGRVYNLIQGMQNHVATAASRPAELAPGILHRVDNVIGAIKTLVSKSQRARVEKVGEALFAGTLEGSSVMDGKVWTDQELRSRFGMDDTGVALYKQARATIDASLDELAAAEAFAVAQNYLPKALRGDIIESPGDAQSLIAAALGRQIDTAIRANLDGESLKSMRDALTTVHGIFDQSEKLKNAGYAPLMRFGKYDLKVMAIDPATGNVQRDEDDKPVTLFYGRYETQAKARAAEKEQADLYAGRDVQIIPGVVNESANELYRGVNPETLSIFAEAIGAREAMDDYIRLVRAERSAMKRKLERKGTPGYSTDIQRVMANFLTSNARQAAQQLYGTAVNQAIRRIPLEKGDVQKEALALRDYVIDPNDKGAFGSSLMFAWFLGGSPASALVNLTQPVMMTLPYLSQYGAARASAAMTKAVPYAMGKKQISDGDLRTALKKASLEGIVDAQEVFHLYSIGSRQLSAGPKSQALMTLWGSMFSAVEGLNRRLTFIAAWDIAKAQGETDPYRFAVNAVNQTQGIYNKANRPNAARSTVGRAVFTFKTYSIMYVELMNRMWKSGPEGKKAVLLMMAVLILASGTEGLPGAKALDDIIDTIGQWMGYDTNMKRWKRRHAYELLGKVAGDLVLYGVSSLTPLDFGGRLGLGNIIPATDILKPSAGVGNSRAIGEIIGPTAGAAQQIGDAVEALSEGNKAQAAINLAPKAIRDAASAARMMSRGYATDAAGRKTVETTMADAVIKGIGFNPTVVADRTRVSMPIQQDIALAKKTETSIVHAWAQAIIDGDQSEAKAQAERLAAWNRDNPDTFIRIKPNQIRDKVHQLTTDKGSRITKSAPKEMRGRVGLEMMK